MRRRTALPGAAALSLLLIALGLLVAGARGSAAPAQAGASSSVEPVADQAPSSAKAPKYTTETVRGRVVWLREALDKQYGVASDPAAAETVVLETPEGHLWPLMPDTRGWAFAVDERLRQIDVQLVVRRYQDSPFRQIIRFFRPKDGGLVEIDYWCDICAIPMFILKPCDCCQGPTRLRETPVENEGSGTGD